MDRIGLRPPQRPTLARTPRRAPQARPHRPHRRPAPRARRRPTPQPTGRQLGPQPHRLRPLTPTNFGIDHLAERSRRTRPGADPQALVEHHSARRRTPVVGISPHNGPEMLFRVKSIATTVDEARVVLSLVRSLLAQWMHSGGRLLAPPRAHGTVHLGADRGSRCAGTEAASAVKRK